MKILTNNKHISWLFVAFIILYYNVDGTISYFLTFIFISYYILVAEKGKIVIIRFLWPIICMLFIGIITGLPKIGIDYVRDIYYFSQPILYIYLGFILDKYKGDKYDFCASLIISAFILSILYLIAVIQNPTILTQSDNIRDIRNEVGKETFIALVGVVLITTQKINIEKKIKYILTPPMVIVFVLQFSRASIGTIAVFYIVYYLLEEHKGSKKVIKRIFLGLIAIGIIILILPNSLLNDFIERLLRSSTEISSNAVQVWTKNNAYANWRGYEIHLVFQAFAEGSFVEKILGYGFGNRVVLGSGITLGGLQSIPVFHNGYIQVLNKLGIVGIGLLLIFYFNVLNFCFKYRRIQNNNLSNLSKFVFSLMCGVIFLAYFKGGIFKGTSIIEIMLFIGILYSRIKKYNKERETFNYE